jgi:uncharacterized protein (TIGR02118 family)
MIKVSVLYPYAEGARFDHGYYAGVHMPMLQQRLGAACQGYAIDKGMAGARAGSTPRYVAMCHIYCESAAAFQAAFAPHARDVMADVANYTDIAPVMQFSEVVFR